MHTDPTHPDNKRNATFISIPPPPFAVFPKKGGDSRAIVHRPPPGHKYLLDFAPSQADAPPSAHAPSSGNASSPPQPHSAPRNTSDT